MAEANRTQQPATQGQAPAPQNNAATPQSQQAIEPAWLKHIPEQEREEAKKSWMLQSDYTKKTTEYAEGRKAWDSEKEKLLAAQKEMEPVVEWYKSVYPKFKEHWDKIQPILFGQQQQQPPTQQNTSTAQPDPFHDYDLLPAQEQAKRLADYVNNQYVSNAISQLEQKFQQELNNRTQFFNNYLGILTDAQQKAFTNPGFNMQEYIAKALELQSGKFNPLELAYNAVTSQGNLDKMQQEWLKKGKEEALLEMQNQNQQRGAMDKPYLPTFRQTPMTKTQIKEAVRNESATKGIPWNNFGS